VFIGAPGTLRPEPVLELARAAAKPLLEIQLITTTHAPNHIVTVRNEQDGWSKDIFGTYRDGSWRFYLEKEAYRSPIVFTFVLDQTAFMSGSDLTILNHSNSVYTENQIQFPETAPRFHHGYDNFYIERTKLYQDSVPCNTREEIRYDVIIIGSGMGGGILADALSDEGVNTLLLEAGGVILPTHMHNLPGRWSQYENNANDMTLPEFYQVSHYKNVDGSGFLRGVHMSLGGRSNYWSGIIPRMQEWELEHWPDDISVYLRNSGFARAEALLRKSFSLGPFQDYVLERLSSSNELSEWLIEELPVSRHQPNIDQDKRLDNVLQSSTGTFSSADLLINSLSFYGSGGRDHLTINLGHLVTHLQTDGDRITGVVCEDLAGNCQRTYIGKTVVLAAGSVESTKIVLNSKIIDSSGLAGVGLTDHPAYFSWFDIPDDNPIAGIENHAKIMLSKKYGGLNRDPFSVQLTINPEYWNWRNSDDEIRNEPNKTRIELIFPFYSHLDNQNFIRSNGIHDKLSIKVNANETGRSHIDEVRMVRNKILDTLGVPHDPKAGMHYGNEGTVHHAGGSLRMSSDHSGVVDTDLKFEQYTNLYCCDPSVWPFIPAANPTLMLAALALRLADTIKNRL
jgi:hypothetical protein